MTPVEPHGLANRPGEPYPATFHFIQWTHWESNPDLQPAELVSSHWTMSPQVERRGIEPRLPGCKPGVFPLDQRPISFLSEVRPGIEPGLRPYHGRVRPKHLQTIN